MTSKECVNQGLVFTAVHDSYWTHAGDIDQMNEILRQQFINLYEQPILENLYADLRMRLVENIVFLNYKFTFGFFFLQVSFTEI